MCGGVPEFLATNFDIQLRSREFAGNGGGVPPPGALRVGEGGGGGGGGAGSEGLYLRIETRERVQTNEAKSKRRRASPTKTTGRRDNTPASRCLPSWPVLLARFYLGWGRGFQGFGFNPNPTVQQRDPQAARQPRSHCAGVGFAALGKSAGRAWGGREGR